MKPLMTITALAMTILASAAAQAAGPTLLDRHQGVWPQPVDGFVTKNQCLRCHGSYDALAEKTKDYVINPHYSHLGAVNCVECHKPDQAKAELMCNSCHKFEVKKAEK